MWGKISIVNQFCLFWKFLGFFQPPFIRRFHALVAVLVALQILSSFMLSQNSQAWSLSHFFYIYHIGVGMILVFISLFFVAYSLNQYGAKNFFPYLWGDISKLKKDIKTSLHLKLVPPRPGGLAATVQGLGLGALLLAVGSGMIWYIVSNLQDGPALALLNFHRAIVGLIELYFIGHGVMAIVHFISWKRNMARKSRNYTGGSEGTEKK